MRQARKIAGEVMDDIYQARGGQSRPQTNRDDAHHATHYWDLRGNQGNIYIIPSGDVAEVLQNAQPSPKTTQGDK